MPVAVVLLVAGAGPALGQAVDPAALLADVAQTAQNIKAWRIQGRIEGSDFAGSDATFTLIQRSAREVRFEQKGGVQPAMIVCDGQNKWTYSPPLNRYTEGAQRRI